MDYVGLQGFSAAVSRRAFKMSPWEEPSVFCLSRQLSSWGLVGIHSRLQRRVRTPCTPSAIIQLEKEKKPFPQYFSRFAAALIEFKHDGLIVTEKVYLWNECLMAINIVSVFEKNSCWRWVCWTFVVGGNRDNQRYLRCYFSEMSIPPVILF